MTDPPAAQIVRQVTFGGASVDAVTVAGSTAYVALNGGATITGDLFAPGLPNVILNGSPNYGGTLDGSGAATPSNYTVTLNSNTTLGHVVRRTDPVPLPIVSAPPSPAGTRSVARCGMFVAHGVHQRTPHCSCKNRFTA